jgi:glycine/D-amino acid oxidase-like deaminating enzyme
VSAGAAPDVAVVGGGIVGCATAAFLAEAGASVRLYERDEVAAAASGRNSGVLQHPMDEALVGLYEASLALYLTLGPEFPLPFEPAGVLVLSDDEVALRDELKQIGDRFAELSPEWLEGDALKAAEPGIGDGLFAYRVATGRPVPPAAAAHRFAARARAAGADVRIGVAVERVALRDGRAEGVVVDGGTEPAGAVVVAAGPWSAELIDPDGDWRPVVPLWGVNVELTLPEPPRHVLEEAGVEALTTPGGGPASIFSIVTAGGVSAVGSTFMPEPPDPAAITGRLLERGARFFPALAGATPVSSRACPRPQSLDGRPLLGPVSGVEGLHLAAGHGAWGISLGPASARLVADAVLGWGPPLPPDLAAERFGGPRPRETPPHGPV